MRGLFLLVIAMGFCPPAWGVAQATAPRVQPLPETEPYVRIANAQSNVVELQIAVRKFLPAENKGPAVWLTGVSHIGETNYFAAIQKHLNAQTLVLFEGVKNGGPERELAQAESGVSSNHLATRQPARSSLQSSMADSLGLAFQLAAIDYHRPNFRNSDLSVQQLRRLIREHGADGAADSFESLLQMMDGGSFWDGLLQVALRFLGSNAKLQALSKLALVEVLGQIKGDPSRLGAVSPTMKQLLEVLIERRNQKVIDDLKIETRSLRARDSVAIFYGTGHMPDLEQRLRKDLGYQPGKQIWLTAFSVDLPKAGISTTEHEFISKFVTRQLEALQTK